MGQLSSSVVCAGGVSWEGTLDWPLSRGRWEGPGPLREGLGRRIHFLWMWSLIKTTQC